MAATISAFGGRAMTRDPKTFVGLEQLDEEHADLRTMLRDLRTAFGEQKQTADQLAALLDRARKVLEEHFRHEENEGFFRGIRETAPQFDDRVTALEHEHPQFLSAMDRLHACVLSHEPEEVWRRDCDTLLEAFFHSFLAHEAAEHELMQDAYTQDMGAKD
jgi:hemerythrin